MGDPRSMTLDGLLSRIDRVVRHHEQLSEWAAPVLDGPIFPQQVERLRLAQAGTTVTWVPQIADPEHPTIAELRCGIDLTGFIAGEPPLLVDGFEETITPLASDIRMHGETAERAARRYRVMPPPPAPEPSRPWWRPSWARWPNP